MESNEIDGFVCVCGNDGTGKSSVVAEFTQRFKNKSIKLFAFERSTEPDGYELQKTKRIVSPKVLDLNTLRYTYDSRLTVLREVKYNGNTKVYPVYWILLDAPVYVIEKRIEDRDVKDIFDTRKALEYYGQRFRELSGFFGIPLIDTSKYDGVTHVVDEILRLVSSAEYTEIYNLRGEILTCDLVCKVNIENRLFDAIDEKSVQEFDTNTIADLFEDGLFGDEVREEFNGNTQLKKHIVTRWLSQGQKTFSKSAVTFERGNLSVSIPRIDSIPYLSLLAEGESKKVFKILTNNPYLKDLVVIILKSTIYSHSKQASSEIENLGQVRAKGTQLFLEMMRRNQLCHSYRCVNEHGVIISDYIETPPTEIVFKKYCEGTDKHSYYGMRSQESIVLATGEYANGMYVRFDWRNPNHVTLKTNTTVTANPFYYVVEAFYGKETFFNIFLKNAERCRPFGDKCVPQDILEGVINVNQTREAVMKMYCTIRYYFDKCDLDVQDGCFMLNKEGDKFWSEINQDCMRIKKRERNESLDKDIWRAGGSASKGKIMEKWNQFNDMFTEHFATHPFLETELKRFNWYPYQDTVDSILADRRLTINSTYNTVYQKFKFVNNLERRVILTMDLYNNEPVLVKSSVVNEVHSNGDIMGALEKISLFPDILIVDLNGAFGECNNNRKVIKQIAKDYFIYTGGGIRSLEDVDDVLASGVRRIVISSNMDDEFIKRIPKDRLIVELSVNEAGTILIHGRRKDTGLNIQDRIRELIKHGVEAISVTFHCTEGHLNGIPRDQIASLVEKTPNSIKKIIIAGGISSLNDLEYLWSFKRVIPQLGSAVWKNKIRLPDLICSMVRFDGLNIVPTIIQEKNGFVKGLVYMNREALRLTCETRLLHRFSRNLKKVVCKGFESRNYQAVIKFSLDCDCDALIVTVDSTNPFCHTGNLSCFNIQTIIKSNLSTINDHLKEKKNGDSYSARMQTHPGLALAKVMEEFWEIVCASKSTQVNECADFLIHFLMYLNGFGISFDSILNELNARRWNPNILKSHVGAKTRLLKRNKIVIAVAPDKYCVKPDEFAKSHLGFKITRSPDRCLKLSHTIVNQDLFEKTFGNKEILLVTARPKDIPWMIAFGTVDAAITYNAVVENCPCVCEMVHEVPDPDICLALIKRKTDIINTNEWCKAKKAVIATEHVTYVHDFLLKENVSEDVFSLDRVVGSSEGFLVNDTRRNYILCDAIVESGKTMQVNDLEIWKEILPKGSIKIGLYKSFSCELP